MYIPSFLQLLLPVCLIVTKQFLALMTLLNRYTPRKVISLNLHEDLTYILIIGLLSSCSVVLYTKGISLGKTCILILLGIFYLVFNFNWVDSLYY